MKKTIGDTRNRSRNLYYLFSVFDRLFTDLSEIFIQKEVLNSYSGLAYAKTAKLKNKLYCHISYVSDILVKSAGVTDIDYSFLSGIEKKYDVCIADMIHADRHIMRFNKNKRLFIAQELLRVFIQDVEQLKITHVFSEGIDDFISYFASIYCKQQHVNFIYLVVARIGSSVIFSNRLDNGVPSFNQKYEDSLCKIKRGSMYFAEVNHFVSSYVKHKRQPDYIRDSDMLYKIFSLSDIARMMNALCSYIRDRNGMHYDKNPFLLPFTRLNKIKRNWQYRKLIKIEKKNNYNFRKLNYFIYPLHFHPEAATLIQGRWFNNQQEIIRLISKNLPVGCLLIVKEHNLSVGLRPISFYRQVADLHNIVFVDDKVDIYDLIEHSKGVVTISSSMGLEALMMRKPVMCFGDVFYNASNNVYNVRDYTNIGEYIQKMLNHKFDWENFLALFYVVLKESFDIGYFTPWNYTKAQQVLLAEKYMEYIAEQDW